MKTNILNNIINNVRVWAIIMVCLIVLGVGNAWGTDWSYTFSSTPTWTGSGTSRTMTINSATWSVSTSNGNGTPTTWGTYANSNSSGGIKFGDSGTNYYGTTTLSTDYFSSSLVSAVTVNLLINGSKTTTIAVTQGVTIGSPSYGTGATWHDFTASTNTGTGGTLTLTITTTQAIYIHSIAVTYTAATPRTVTFNKQGGTFDNPAFDSDNTLTEASGGAGVTLPLVNPSSACAPEGWGFYGWATSPVTSSTTSAPTIVGKAGDTYHPSSNITLHAVFAQGEYTKETSAITSGAKYLIVANSTKNYVMTDSYSLNGSTGRGEMASAQIDETTSGKYSAASVNAQWCYTIEASSTLYYIRDVKNSSTNNYVDIAYFDWYGNTEDPQDMYDISLNEEKWGIMNYYSFFYFNSTSHVFTNDPDDYTEVYLYKAGTIYYYSTPSCCEYEVSVSESGSSHITSMTFNGVSSTSVPTCGNAASRTITITVTPASGYTLFGDTKPVFTKTNGTATATIGSVTDNGNGTFSYECTFNSNDNGAGTFAISPGQFTNYRTKCCTDPELTFLDVEGDPTTEYTIVREDLASSSTAVEIACDFESNNTTSSITWSQTKRIATTYHNAYTWSGSQTDRCQIILTDPTNKKISAYETGSWQITISQSAGETSYCDATATVNILVKTVDKFVDAVNGNFSGEPQRLEDVGNGILLPTEETFTTNNACHSTTRRLVGWIKASDLNSYRTGGRVNYIDDLKTGGKVIAPGTRVEASGVTWYAVWGEEVVAP